MVTQNKVLGLIGLSAKAGKIAFGAEQVEEFIEKNKAKLVIIAEDASSRTKENFEKLCKKKNLRVVTYQTIENLSKAIGKQNKAVIAILDKNLGEEIYKIICGGVTIG